MSTKQKPHYEGRLAESVCFAGDQGDIVGGYMARQLGPGPYAGVIVIHEAYGLVARPVHPYS